MDEFGLSWEGGARLRKDEHGLLPCGESIVLVVLIDVGDSA